MNGRLQEVWIVGGDLIAQKILMNHSMKSGYSVIHYETTAQCLDPLLMGFSEPEVILIPRGYTQLLYNSRLISFLKSVRPTISIVELNRQEVLSLRTDEVETDYMAQINEALERLSEFCKRLNDALGKG